MPEGGMDRRRYLELKFGGPANASAIYDQVRAAGASEGIEFAFEAMRRTPNTVDSHRLIRHAADTTHQAERRQDAVVQALFDAYPAPSWRATPRPRRSGPRTWARARPASTACPASSSTAATR
jgi:hypothetical protein